MRKLLTLFLLSSSTAFAASDFKVSKAEYAALALNPYLIQSSYREPWSVGPNVCEANSSSEVECVIIHYDWAGKKELGPVQKQLEFQMGRLIKEKGLGKVKFTVTLLPFQRTKAE